MAYPVDRNPVVTGRFSPDFQPPAGGDALRARLESRLGALREEFAQGQDQLNQAEARARYLREQLLRLAGAIQVLEEELGAHGDPG